MPCNIVKLHGSIPVFYDYQKESAWNLVFACEVLSHLVLEGAWCLILGESVDRDTVLHLIQGAGGCTGDGCITKTEPWANR